MKAGPLPFHYLAVDGPIGVGKTTLVEMLAERFSGVKILEDVANPFLTDFYEDRPGAAFQTELYFLLTRYKQQLDVTQKGLFDRLMVSDYTFQKNRVFAYLNLGDEELMIFDKLYTLLEPQVPPPDLVLYLVGDLQSCLERIRRRYRAVPKNPPRENLVDRVREVEKNIAPEYLTELIDAYNHYYHYYKRSPLLVVDTRELNFPDRPEDFDELVHRLRQPVRGTEYYVPLGSRRGRGR